MHYTLEGVKSELPYYQEILLFYKVDPCPSLHTKDNKDTLHRAQDQLCFHYHQQSERRRKVFSDKTSSMLYQPLKCPFAFPNSPCPKEDNCEFSHNETELSFHPLYYKTEPCSGCPYETNSKYCPYYHSDENSRKNVLEKFRSKMIKNTFRNHQNSANIEETTSTLDRFKAKPCQIKGNHNPKVCEYYHHEKDRKRPVSIYNYTINMCSYIEKNRPCPSGDDCGSCHNKVEQLYHPQKYKKKFCTDHPHNLHKCEYGNFCSFAHSENEIQIELLHNMKKDSNFYLYKYKTVFCPYIYGHDRNHCVYAHNPQDFRRDPTKYSYNPVQCLNWSKKQIYSYEEGGCPDEMQCKQCHGWKELEYNPLYYKTELCRNISKCGKRGDCPFYHSEAEQRKSLTHQILLNPANNSIPFGKENLYFINQNIQNQDKTTKTSNYHFGSTKTTVNEMPLQMNTNGPKEAHPRFTSNFPKNIIVNNYAPQDKKNTRFKNMSLQHKSGHLVNPMIPRMERPKGLSVGNESLASENFQCNFIQQEETVYNDFKPLGSEPSSKENELNKSIDSLHSFTGEESKPSDLEENQEVGDAQFVDNLLRNLEKKELEHEATTLQSRFAGIKLKNDCNEEDDITFGEQDSRRNRFDASDTFQRSSY